MTSSWRARRYLPYAFTEHEVERMASVIEILVENEVGGNEEVAAPAAALEQSGDRGGACAAGVEAQQHRIRGSGGSPSATEMPWLPPAPVEGLIRVIRGQKVMLDAELAELFRH